jgi:hypothetical protein
LLINFPVYDPSLSNSRNCCVNILVAGGQGALQKPQLVSKRNQVGWSRFIPHLHRVRAAKRYWLGKEINHDSIPQAAADNVDQRWATHHDLPGDSPVCGLFCVSYKPRPARTTIASQVWIGFFLSLNLHRLDVVVRLPQVTQ